MHRLTVNPKLHNLSLLVLQIMPIAAILLLRVSVAYGLELGQRSITLGNDSPGAVTSYDLDFITTSGETLGSIEILFCANSPLVNDSCSVPTGLNVAAAVLNSQTGPGNFSIYQATADELVLTRPPSYLAAQELNLDFTNVTNPANAGSFYARLQTFPTPDGSGEPNDTGGVALDINSSVTVSTYVPPYLYFCSGVAIANLNCNDTSGDYIDFGDLSTSAVSSSDSQLLVATNALNGYSIQVSGGSMTSGNNVISPLSSAGAASPGQDQFGLNLVANSKPAVGADVQGPGTGLPAGAYAQPNVFKYSNGDVIAGSSEVSDLREYTISYIIDINSGQPPGYYATTLTYIGMGNF